MDKLHKGEFLFMFNIFFKILSTNPVIIFKLKIINIFNNDIFRHLEHDSNILWYNLVFLLISFGTLMFLQLIFESNANHPHSNLQVTKALI